MLEKTIGLLLLLGIFSSGVSALGTSEEKKNLKDLLEVRRNKFAAYSDLLEQKSGIFGNKTKKDVLKSHDVLIEIVETDNRIISALNHVIDFRTTEKVNRNYESFDKDKQIDQLQLATDTLVSQVNMLKLLNADLKTTAHVRKWLVYLLSLILAVLLITRWRRKSSAR